MKTNFQLILLIISVIFSACGGKIFDSSSSSSENKYKEEEIKEKENDDSMDAPTSTWQSELNGSYLHILHGLAGPYFEIKDGKFTSIEVLGSADGFFLSEIYEGTVIIKDQEHLEFHYSRSSNPFSELEELVLDLSHYEKNIIDFMNLLKSGYIDDQGLFQEHDIIHLNND